LDPFTIQDLIEQLGMYDPQLPVCVIINEVDNIHPVAITGISSFTDADALCLEMAEDASIQE
jgi:hypothetical protein